MPKREDENWVRWREDKEGIRRKTLCPFCGKGDRLYYKLYIRKGENTWRCAWCSKSFPIPSGGKITKAQIKHIVHEHYAFLDKYKEKREQYPQESYQQTQKVRESRSKKAPAYKSRSRPLKDEFVEHRVRMQRYKSDQARRLISDSLFDQIRMPIYRSYWKIMHYKRKITHWLK